MMKTETRIYGIAVNEAHDVDDYTDGDFIDEAEGQGNVWTLDPFIDYLNNQRLSGEVTPFVFRTAEITI